MKDFEDIFGENSEDYFEFIIKKFELEALYNVYQNENDEIIIDEQWVSPKTKSVTANRFFKFDILFLDLIDPDQRLDILNKILKIYVDGENYEEAIHIRDLIESYN